MWVVWTDFDGDDTLTYNTMSDLGIEVAARICIQVAGLDDILGIRFGNKARARDIVGFRGIEVQLSTQDTDEVIFFSEGI